MRQAPDPGAVGAEVGLDLGGQLANGGEVDAEQARTAPAEPRAAGPFGLWRGTVVDVAMDVFHALVAVIAQGSIVVVGEEPDEYIGAVLCRSKQPQGRAPCLCVTKVSLSGLVIGDQS